MIEIPFLAHSGIQVFLQRNGVVMFCVMRTVDQGDQAVACGAADRPACLRMAVQLCKIAFLELGPLLANMSEANRLKHEQIPLTDLRMAGVIKRLNSDIDDQDAHGNVFATYVSLSPLAIAEDVVPLVTSTWERFKELDLSSPELIAANMPEKQKTLGELLRKLQAAGRKDLWGTPEPEAKAEAAKQT
jgi:hypothetical protein